MDKPIVVQNLEISSYETDVNARINASALQNLLQEVAYKGSEFCKCSYRTLREKDMFWALNRIRFQILDTPVWGDRVILQTWSRGQIGPLWHRNFRMVRESDPETPIVLGTSAWTIVSIKERSIVRGECGFDPSYHYDEDTLPLCSKIIVPRDLEQKLTCSRIVAWSDLDTNGHANNCQYTQWVIDSLPFDYLKEHTLKDVEVNYYHEIHYGEDVKFFLARRDHEWFVTGKVEDRICFVEKLEFA